VFHFPYNIFLKYLKTGPAQKCKRALSKISSSSIFKPSILFSMPLFFAINKVSFSLSFSASSFVFLLASNLSIRIDASKDFWARACA
jgi:hypothetical protein